MLVSLHGITPEQIFMLRKNAQNMFALRRALECFTVAPRASALGAQVPSGGWFSLMMAAIYAYIMLLWYYGSSRKNRCAALRPPRAPSYLISVQLLQALRDFGQHAAHCVCLQHFAFGP